MDSDEINPTFNPSLLDIWEGKKLFVSVNK